ncbi:recombination regulator RecX [Candidatus Bipolaricaulota bacterium]|nr:recombination regulator RecX [Candidatus Bipolaricaulota bacterium]
MKPNNPKPSDPWAYLTLLLRYRPRSIAEARQRMAQQGYDSTITKDTIDQAIATGLLDDAGFAKLWIRDRMWHHPLSRAAIAQELRQKGIDPELVAATLQAEYPAVQEVELATGLAETRMRNSLGINPDKRRNRLISLLERRGFSRGVVYQVVTAVEKEFERAED